MRLVPSWFKSRSACNQIIPGALLLKDVAVPRPRQRIGDADLDEDAVARALAQEASDFT